MELIRALNGLIHVDFVTIIHNYIWISHKHYTDIITGENPTNLSHTIIYEINNKTFIQVDGREQVRIF